jgi:hypothetical protein
MRMYKVFSIPTERPQWAQEKQTDPPNFGQSKRIPRWLLNLLVWRRQRKTEKILQNSTNYCSFEPGFISLVVLSCKRFPEFKRLCTSMVPFFQEVENYPKLEIILVDNGSDAKLVEYAKQLNFFDTIIAHPENLGMAGALNDVYQHCKGEYIMLIEDDMIVDYEQPFLNRCIEVLNEFDEIGLIRLKNQNNWWKPFRIISPLRTTSSETAFWTWLPSFPTRSANVWACGSVLFRKLSFFSTGLLPVGEGRMQASLVESTYGKLYNKTWLAAKVKDCYPVFQPNDNLESPGFDDKILSGEN